MKLLTTALTDVGRVRSVNEDSFVLDDEAGVFAVADGMGGHQAGEVASALAIDALRTGLADGRPLDEVIVDANTAVVARASEDPGLRGMGTTLTAAVRGDDQVLVIGHVGDSRAYLLRGDTFEQLTVDHSVVAELIAAGQLTEAEAEIDPRRAMITRALGIDVDVEVDVIPVELELGDRVLLCSDGLNATVHDDDMAELLRGVADRARAAQALVDAANEAGGVDNITVLLIDVVDDDTPDDPEPAAEPAAPSAPIDADADTLDLGEPPAVDPLADLDIDLDEPLEVPESASAPDGEPEPEPEPAPKRHWWQRRKQW
jgi:PPM family protein phosphatase